MQTAKCLICGGSFQFEPIIGFPFNLQPTVCNACDEKDKASAVAAADAARFEQWKTICPPLYQDTDPNHPAMPPAAKLAKILNWQYGPKGLVIVGLTRRCKTRSMWLLLKRLVLEGRTVEAMTSHQFSTQCAEVHSQGADAVDDWFNRLLQSDILFIDDLGKFKLTERVEADLFEVIEQRTSRLSPLLLTSNFKGEELQQKMTPDRGAPIVARIREFCESITL